ncbi:hypothetical protein [Arsenophonus endosymbiont of Crataerina pallida]|uniref:AbiTii domain-containing protein n=1 Tax=Arsenophonus endosymbiont of Crataerina pallida TaxID=3066235 RepID=UPI0030D2BC76
MSILFEIQRNTTESNVSISGLLRKCLYFASKIDNKDFKFWVLNELNGYVNSSELPNYRILNCIAKCDLIQHHNYLTFNNQLIRLKEDTPDHYKNHCSTLKVREKVSVIEDLLFNNQSGIITAYWDSRLVNKFSNFYKGFDILRAWSEVPANLYFGMLDEIKTRVLQFALEAESHIKGIEDIEL